MLVIDEDSNDVGEDKTQNDFSDDEEIVNFKPKAKARILSDDEEEENEVKNSDNECDMHDERSKSSDNESNKSNNDSDNEEMPRSNVKIVDSDEEEKDIIEPTKVGFNFHSRKFWNLK